MPLFGFAVFFFNVALKRFEAVACNNIYQVLFDASRRVKFSGSHELCRCLGFIMDILAEFRLVDFIGIFSYEPAAQLLLHVLLLQPHDR